MEIRDKIELVAIDKLVPYARNSRTHTDAQVAQIAASMREWGWTNPVLVDEHGGIIAGHGRVLAARQLGLAEVPVIVARGWSETQKRAYVIADNKLALNADWNHEMLAAEIADLAGLGIDMLTIGFDDGEVDSLINQRPRLVQHVEGLAPISMARVLISFPTDRVADVKTVMGQLVALPFVEVDYGGN